jgi:hypothetical protein
LSAALWWGWSCGLAGEEREEAGSLAALGMTTRKATAKATAKAWLVEVLLSHVSDDKAVASVGHPGGGGGAGEEREEAGSLGCASE